MRIVFMGTPQFSVTILKRLHRYYPVGLIVTQPDKKVGRKQLLKESAVKKFANEENIEVITPYQIKNEYQKIIDYQPDLIVTASYGQILPKEIISSFTSINVHGSLLPKRRGGAPVQRAIMEGDLKTGISLIYLSKKMDAGKIIAQSSMPILNSDTTTILMNKLALLGADLLLEYLPKIINKTVISKKQNEALVTYSYNLTKKDEILNFNQTTHLILRQLNGLLEEPAGSIFVDKKRIKVFKLRKSDIISNASPNEIIACKKSLLIKSLDGVVEIVELQEEGKKRMMASDYLNGQKSFIKGGKINETVIFSR
ncbi:MAG: methionyl-tRNA formyltransferase [Acholeplasmatales bacterium]|jgi:methionyl-tRNA formyltransferase|nr:methionyl-tRNA formyltransferase [Acholeplasmataceae bacterium]MDY0114952.1 methionyl-tRNA formyltransferase [Acholeplasmatales bacterium]MCK9233881.1 methionyl-tRNA formyltransferase [Acholeplasmataceae bacterium]MCK9289128.1 methionyl-tRNA formyltransferase [Acholeplasmataceae bacterium]MCK9427108.1 methionyl-tRNA formyltransferase [Acholeplasmataceae bacterium]